MHRQLDITQLGQSQFEVALDVYTRAHKKRSMRPLKDHNDIGTIHLHSTVNSRFKKDLNLQIHLHKAFFLDDRFLDSLHKSFLNQTTLDFGKEKGTFLN